MNEKPVVLRMLEDEWHKAVAANPMANKLTISYELLEVIAKELDKTAQAETEGDGRATWWYVCGECHTAIDTKDRFCRECGRRIIW